MPRLLLLTLLGVYLVALALIGFWPSTVDGGVQPQIYDFVRWCADAGFGFVTYQLIERAANVVLFLPFGLLLGGLLPRGYRAWGILIVVGVTFAIEIGQMLFLPGRYPSLSDLVTNTLGGTIGIVIVLILGHRRARRRDRQPVGVASDSRYRGE